MISFSGKRKPDTVNQLALPVVVTSKNVPFSNADENKEVTSIRVVSN